MSEGVSVNFSNLVCLFIYYHAYALHFFKTNLSAAWLLVRYPDVYVY